jgi:hypothetical protein
MTAQAAMASGMARAFSTSAEYTSFPSVMIYVFEPVDDEHIAVVIRLARVAGVPSAAGEHRHRLTWHIR